jgi:hypothetical protein
MSTSAGASTYAIGRIAMNRFARDGSLVENIDWDRAKAEYREALKKGKEIASKMRRKAERESPEKADLWTSDESASPPRNDHKQRRRPHRIVRRRRKARSGNRRAIRRPPQARR